jgi:uncharacterized protein (TIGR02391 family)
MGSISYSIIFDSELYLKITPEYASGNYSSAIKTAILYLTEEIRKRTDLDIDGDSLITKAFSENNPLIKLNKLETETDRSEQAGYMQMLQGLYKAIRNPRNHNLKEDSKESCDDILIMINYFLKLIQKAKTKFDFLEFSALVKDSYFVCKKQYALEIVKNIPEEKYLEVAQKMLEDISGFPVDNFACILLALKEKIKDDKYISFIKLLDNVLFRTTNIELVKASTIILQENWSELSNATKLRTEKILYTSLSNSEFIWENEPNRYGNYVTHSYLNDDGITASYIRYIPFRKTETLTFTDMKHLIDTILLKDNEYIDYIFDYFYQYILNDHHDINEAFDETIIKLIVNKDSKMYKVLTSGIYTNDNFTPTYNFSDDIQKTLDKVV